MNGNLNGNWCCWEAKGFVTKSSRHCASKYTTFDGSSRNIFVVSIEFPTFSTVFVIKRLYGLKRKSSMTDFLSPEFIVDFTKISRSGTRSRSGTIDISRVSFGTGNLRNWISRPGKNTRNIPDLTTLISLLSTGQSTSF